MANKSKPIGVRFRQDLLDALKEDGLADSPQKALNFLSEFYRENKPNKMDFVKAFSESAIFKQNKTNTAPPENQQANSQGKLASSVMGEKCIVNLITKPPAVSNYTVDTEKEAKTLKELAQLNCPSNLKGLDRTEWIMNYIDSGEKLKKDKK